MRQDRRSGRNGALLFWVLPLLFLLSPPGRSEAFNMVGARSMGMGGAFVAVTDDASAVYWNPAGVTQIKGVDITAFAGAKATDHFYDIWHDLEDWNDEDPDDLDELRDILERFNEDEAGVIADGSAGLAVAGKWFGVSAVALGQGYLDPFADTDHLLDRSNNSSRVEVSGLVTADIALTLATTLGIPNLAFGTNLKYIQGYQYTDKYYVFDQTTGEYNDDIDYKKRFNDNRIEGWAWGIDAGVLILLGDWLKIGALGRNINEPKIDWEKDAPETKLRGQYRVGVAFTPFKTFTLSADADITEQAREVIETESGGDFEFNASREISAGLEWWLLDRHLALRGGVNNITDDGEAGRFYTAGLGIRIPYLEVDLAGGYGGDRRYAASVALSLRF